MKRLCEIEGARRALEGLLKAIDKVRQQAEQRLQKSISKTGRNSEQSLALNAEWREIDNTIDRWEYLIRGRMSDLDQAAKAMYKTELRPWPRQSSAMEENHETTAENAAQATGSDQGEPGPGGSDRQLRQTGHAAVAED